MKEISAAESARNRDHMANERTFLAWIRTSIGIMALGFVFERFALFLKQTLSIFHKDFTQTPEASVPHYSYSSLFGILLVVAGALIGLVAFIKYRKDKINIDEGTYQASWKLGGLVTILVVLTGIFLVIYLLQP